MSFRHPPLHRVLPPRSLLLLVGLAVALAVFAAVTLLVRQ
jgi:hypothetical protein